MNRLFLIFWSAVVIILIGLMVMLYTSLLPHFVQIGNVATWVLYAWMGFGTAAGWVLISLKIYRTWVYRNVVAVGEVVAYRNGDGQFEHLSARHEQAKVPRLLPAPKDEPPLEGDEQTVLEMYNDGQMTLEAIADFNHMKYWKVQRIIADAKKRGLVNRK